MLSRFADNIPLQQRLENDVVNNTNLKNEELKKRPGKKIRKTTLVNITHGPRMEGLLKSCAALWTGTNGKCCGNSQELIDRYGLDDETSLLEKLDKTGQALLKQAAALAKVPLESLAPFRPWPAALMLEKAYYNQLPLAESGTAEKMLS